MTYLPRPTNNSQRFTLIELLVVISITALLISILLPALKSARRAAQTIKCASQLHQISLGTMSYLQDSNNRFTVVDWDGTNFPESYLSQNRVKEDSIFTCAEHQRSEPSLGWSYNINITLNRYASSDEDLTVSWKKIDNVKTPSEGAWWLDGYSPVYVDSTRGSWWPRATGAISTSSSVALRTNIIFLYAHPGHTINVVYIDGHGGNVNDTFLEPTNSKDTFWYGGQ